MQDYYIEVHRENTEKDFFCTITIYYSFDKNNEEESIEFFSISAATPLGIANYLSSRFQDGTLDNISLFPHLIVMETYNQEKLLDHIKREMESVYGRTEEEVILKLLRNFDWEHASNNEVMNNLFKRL